MAVAPDLGALEATLRRLDAALQKRAPQLQKYEDYDAGKHKLAFATSRFRKTFGNLFSAFADNWCPLVIDAANERLAVEGFRFSDAREADQEAWDLWKRSHMDADSSLAHREAIKLGQSYCLVNPGPDGPRITVESPFDVIVARKSGTRRERAAALKKWLDESGRFYATLYLPAAVYKFESELPVDQVESTDPEHMKWRRRRGVEFATPNPLGVVPVVPLLNSPTMTGDGRSDLDQVIPIQDAVNKLVTDMIVASEFAAFRQRWATGLEIPTDPDTGRPLVDEQRFLASVARVWTVEDSEARFGEFSASDLRNYVVGIEMLIQHLAARTRTPPHYLLGQSGAFPSGESLKSTETGLVAKCVGKQLVLGEGHEEVMRLCFLAKGDRKRGNDYGLEVIWRDPESRSMGEVVDAALKLKMIGVPTEALWERIGASQAEIARWRVMAEQEALDMLTASLSAGGAHPLGQGLPGERIEPDDGDDAS